ncbi:MAG TPA: VCBS repeat-containing protein [Candidatus Handelsmanbacteria bacterium]|nr:VCBS repeat-containing protein [Candidatus Handelsmanbacteria bacterium]
MTAVDADSDGRVDLLTEGTDGQPQLLRDIGPRFEPSKLWDFGDMGVATTVTLADMDDDGDKDAAFSGSVAGIGLQDDGHFQPVTTDFDRCVDAVFGDLDHDGDADIACAGNKLGLWSNDGTGDFRDITASTEGDGARTRQVLFSDLDTDRDVDILTAGGTGFGLYSNNRDGTFTDVAATRGLKGADIRALAVADFAANGSMDVAAVSGSGASLFVNEGTQFTENSLDMVADANGLIGADLDNDGDIDLLLGTDNGLELRQNGSDDRISGFGSLLEDF